jgi:hypothetical protein
VDEDRNASENPNKSGLSERVLVKPPLPDKVSDRLNRMLETLA